MLRKEVVTKLRFEFDRQVANLLQKGYPKAAGISTAEFLKFLEPLKVRIPDVSPVVNGAEEGHLPFVIVVKIDLVTAEFAVPLIEH